MPPPSPPNRRDFLKFLSALSLTWFAQPLITGLGRSAATRAKPQGSPAPNVIILVFDAWSANHVQFYGYPRLTMPNLERFASRATVFHNHYSAGSFTVPGTASLLTGLHPWSHRALSLGSAGIIKSHVDHQLFSTFAPTHSTLAFTQNKFADILLFQVAAKLNRHLPAGAFNLEQHRFFYNLPWFRNDSQAAFAALDDNFFLDGSDHDSSLFINPLFRLWHWYEEAGNARGRHAAYPLGLPNDTEQFLLGDVVDGAVNTLKSLDEPGLVYFHFYPPHENYRPLEAFSNRFKEGWQPPEKPIHWESLRRLPYHLVNALNQQYDEYIASWDSEVNRLFQYLADSGLLDRSYVFITADHGELNERGETGHFTPMIFEPLIHIPLIVSRPGQRARQDVFAPTSSVDVLPTLAHLCGLPIPDWTEGSLLPGLGGQPDPGRSIFSMDAKTNASFAPFTRITMSLTKNGQRLTHYRYPDRQSFEFYDLRQDPEEMNDLYPRQPIAARALEEELLTNLATVNGPGQD